MAVKPFQGLTTLIRLQPPGFSLRSNPGLELANAIGVFQAASIQLVEFDLHFYNCASDHISETNDVFAGWII
jgi:hypothetical protein